MGTSADKFEYLLETKAQIKEAIRERGVDVTDTDTFRSYVDKIKNLPDVESGGTLTKAEIVGEWYYFVESDNANSVWQFAQDGTATLRVRASGIDTAFHQTTYTIEDNSVVVADVGTLTYAYDDTTGATLSLTQDDVTQVFTKKSIYNFQEKIVTENSEVIADSGYDGLSKVTVNVATPILQDKEVVPSKESQIISADTEFDAINTVTVLPIPDEYIVPEGSLEVTENDTYDVRDLAEIIVNVEGSGGGDTLAEAMSDTLTTYNGSATGIKPYTFQYNTNLISFKNIEIGLYSAIAIYLSGKMIDIVFEGVNFCKAIYIISDESENISKAIIAEMDKGVTGFYGKGIYKNSDKLILMCITKRRNIARLKETIKRIDKYAFIMIIDAREVYGLGFKK